MKVIVAYRGSASGDRFAQLMPVGVPSLVAVLRRAGVDAVAANFSTWDDDRIAVFIRRENPALVAFSMMTHNRRESLAAARVAKTVDPSVTVLAGGPHATHRYRELLTRYPDLDVVVLGEGETTILEVVERIRSGCVLDGISGVAVRREGVIPAPVFRSPIADLDSLPFPAEGLADGIGFDPRDQAEFIISSRGCPSSCRFCSSPRFWRSRLRFRSPASMVEEIRYIRQRYGLIYFSFRDDTFTADRDRVEEFCRLLLSERLYILWNCQSRVTSIDAQLLKTMKKAGCEAIQLGIESGSSRILKTLGKQATPAEAVTACALVRDAGIDLSVYLVTGIPGEDDTDVAATCALLEQIRADDGQVSPLVYYPGTALYADAVHDGTVSADLFEESAADAFPVRNDPFVKRSVAKILAAVERHSPPVTARLEAERQQHHGFTFAGWLRIAEQYRHEERFRAAEKLLHEIVRRQPENPWGWLGLAELFLEEGRFDKGEQALVKLVNLVPSHLPAYDLLIEVAAARNDLRKRREWVERRRKAAAGA